MSNNKLIVSTLVASMLAVAGTASAAPMDQQANRGNITPAKSAQQSAENTLTKKVVDERGELKATQPGAIEVNTIKGLENTPRQANRMQREMNRVETQSDAAESALRGNNANLAPVTPARERARATQNTLNQRVEDARGELKATQPGRVELNQGTQRRAANRNAQPNNAANNRVIVSGKPISQQPLLKGEVNTGQVTPASVRNTPAPVTLQQRVKDRVGELQATQPGEVEVQESRSIRTQ